MILQRVDTGDLRKSLPDHAKYGPSSMKRILKCLLSTLPDGAVYGKSSDAAQLGTKAHEAGEIGILEGKRAEDTLTVEEHGQDTIDAVNIYIDYVNEIIKRCEDSTEFDGQWKIEGKFVFNKYFFGTADFTGIERTIFHCVDYKNGIAGVEAIGNEQALSYAGLALIDATMYPDSEVEKIETFKIAIVQPRSSGEPIKEWECSMQEVLDHLEKVIAVLNMTEDEIRATEYVHGEHCFFCPRKIACPKLIELTTSVMQDDFTIMSSEELGTQLENTILVEERIKAIRAYAYDKANSGSKVDGWKLVNKRATRKWKSEAMLVDLATKCGYNEDDLYTSKVKTPAMVENLVGKANFDDFAPYVEAISSGTNLVKSSARGVEVFPKQAFNNAIDKLKAFNLKS